MSNDQFETLIGSGVLSRLNFDKCNPWTVEQARLLRCGLSCQAIQNVQVHHVTDSIVQRNEVLIWLQGYQLD